VFDEDNPEEFIKDSSEKILLIQLSAMGIFAAWAVGGNCSWAPGMIAAIGLFAPVLLLIHNSTTLSGRLYPKLRYLGLATPVWLWLIVLALCYFQPLRMPHLFNGLEFFSLENPDPMTPGSTLAVHWVGALMLCGVYLGALNLLIVPETRLSLRMLLRALSINAMLLAFLGFLTMVLGTREIAFFLAPPSDDFFSLFPAAPYWCAFALLWIGVLCGFVVEEARTRPPRQFLIESAYPLCGIALLGTSIALRGSALQVLILGLLTGAAGILAAGQARKSRMGGAAFPLVLTIVGAGLLVAGIVGGITLASELPDWLSNAKGTAGAPDWDTRVLLWQTATQVFADRPLWGWGPNSFGAVLSFFQPAELGTRFYGLAHSNFVQSLVENGVILTALWIIFPLGLLLKYLGKVSRSAFCQIPLLGCLAVALSALIDQPFACPAVMVSWFIIFFAVIQWARLEGKAARPKVAPKPLLKRNAPVLRKD